MSEDFGTFVKRLNRRAKNFDENSEKLRKDVADEMFTEVVLATPADTGTARSNWQVGINSAPEGVLPAYAEGRNLGTGEMANAGAAISKGVPTIRSSTNLDRVYIVNNVPYIGLLNAGSSQQAGANFIERAFDRARKRVQRARALMG